MTYCIQLVKDRSSFYEIRSLAICIICKVFNRVNRKQLENRKTGKLGANSRRSRSKMFFKMILKNFSIFTGKLLGSLSDRFTGLQLFNIVDIYTKST